MQRIVADRPRASRPSQVLLFIIWQQILGFFYTGKEPGMPDDWKLTFQRGFDNTFTLLAFLLGGFVTRHVLRWRAKRDHYQMILTKTRSIITLAAAYFQDPTQRHQMGRYANLAFMLVAMEEQVCCLCLGLLLCGAGLSL